MFELENLQLHLQNLKVLFNEAIADPEISNDQLRKIREEIYETERLIVERKVMLSRKGSGN